MFFNDKKKFFILLISVSLFLYGCSEIALDNKVNAGNIPVCEDSVFILLSDKEIKINGKKISENSDNAVYIGTDIVYYEEGKDKTYGEGKKEDSHSKEEAQKHTVLTISESGTYMISGKISYGQIVIDLGKDARENKDAVVNLILNNVEINCSVAPSIVVYNAYECSDDSKKNAAHIVDTRDAGFNLILAENSENIINGSYVAKIYKEGTSKEDVKNGDAKKKYKFDGAIDSQVSFNIDSEEGGRLTVNAENEGISSNLHMTINNGEIIVNAKNDSINTNKDDVSVFTMNDGTLICNSDYGDAGDGIDSNGYIVINGGYVVACANSESIDSGIDADKGIYLNGGTVFASGNMYDKISSGSRQQFLVFGFDNKINKNDLIMVMDEENCPVAAFNAVNDYFIAVYSSPNLTKGNYYFYKVSSVVGNLNRNIYTNITDYQNEIELLSTFK